MSPIKKKRGRKKKMDEKIESKSTKATNTSILQPIVLLEPLKFPASSMLNSVNSFKKRILVSKISQKERNLVDDKMGLGIIEEAVAKGIRNIIAQVEEYDQSKHKSNQAHCSTEDQFIENNEKGDYKAVRRSRRNSTNNLDLKDRDKVRGKDKRYAAMLRISRKNSSLETDGHIQEHQKKFLTKSGKLDKRYKIVKSMKSRRDLIQNLQEKGETNNNRKTSNQKFNSNIQYQKNHVDEMNRIYLALGKDRGFNNDDGQNLDLTINADNSNKKRRGCRYCHHCQSCSYNSSSDNQENIRFDDRRKIMDFNTLRTDGNEEFMRYEIDGNELEDRDCTMTEDNARSSFRNLEVTSNLKIGHKNTINVEYNARRVYKDADIHLRRDLNECSEREEPKEAEINLESQVFKESRINSKRGGGYKDFDINFKKGESRINLKRRSKEAHINEDREDPKEAHNNEVREDPKEAHINEDREDPKEAHINAGRKDFREVHMNENPNKAHINEDRRDPKKAHINAGREDPRKAHINKYHKEAHIKTSREDPREARINKDPKEAHINAGREDPKDTEINSERDAPKESRINIRRCSKEPEIKEPKEAVINVIRQKEKPNFQNERTKINIRRWSMDAEINVEKVMPNKAKINFQRRCFKKTEQTEIQNSNKIRNNLENRGTKEDDLISLMRKESAETTINFEKERPTEKGCTKEARINLERRGNKEATIKEGPKKTLSNNLGTKDSKINLQNREATINSKASAFKDAEVLLANGGSKEPAINLEKELKMAKINLQNEDTRINLENQGSKKSRINLENESTNKSKINLENESSKKSRINLENEGSKTTKINLAKTVTKEPLFNTEEENTQLDVRPKLLPEIQARINLARTVAKEPLFNTEEENTELNARPESLLEIQDHHHHPKLIQTNAITTNRCGVDKNKNAEKIDNLSIKSRNKLSEEEKRKRKRLEKMTITTQTNYYCEEFNQSITNKNTINNLNAKNCENSLNLLNSSKTKYKILHYVQKEAYLSTRDNDKEKDNNKDQANNDDRNKNANVKTNQNDKKKNIENENMQQTIAEYSGDIFNENQCDKTTITNTSKSKFKFAEIQRKIVENVAQNTQELISDLISERNVNRENQELLESSEYTFINHQEDTVVITNKEHNLSSTFKEVNEACIYNNSKNVENLEEVIPTPKNATSLENKIATNVCKTPNILINKNVGKLNEQTKVKTCLKSKQSKTEFRKSNANKENAKRSRNKTQQKVIRNFNLRKRRALFDIDQHNEELANTPPPENELIDYLKLRRKVKVKFADDNDQTIKNKENNNENVAKNVEKSTEKSEIMSTNINLENKQNENIITNTNVNCNRKEKAEEEEGYKTFVEALKNRWINSTTNKSEETTWIKNQIKETPLRRDLLTTNTTTTENVASIHFYNVSWDESRGIPAMMGDSFNEEYNNKSSLSFTNTNKEEIDNKNDTSGNLSLQINHQLMTKAQNIMTSSPIIFNYNNNEDNNENGRNEEEQLIVETSIQEPTAKSNENISGCIEICNNNYSNNELEISKVKAKQQSCDEEINELNQKQSQTQTQTNQNYGVGFDLTFIENYVESDNELHNNEVNKENNDNEIIEESDSENTSINKQNSVERFYSNSYDTNYRQNKDNKNLQQKTRQITTNNEELEQQEQFTDNEEEDEDEETSFYVRSKNQIYDEEKANKKYEIFKNNAKKYNSQEQQQQHQRNTEIALIKQTLQESKKLNVNAKIIYRKRPRKIKTTQQHRININEIAIASASTSGSRMHHNYLNFHQRMNSEKRHKLHKHKRDDKMNAKRLKIIEEEKEKLHRKMDTIIQIYDCNDISSSSVYLNSSSSASSCSSTGIQDASHNKQRSLGEEERKEETATLPQLKQREDLN